MNRRELLQLFRARPPVKAHETVLLRLGRRAMATTFEVLVGFGTPSAQQAADAALAEIDAIEAQMTVFRDDSEVSRINRRAADEPVEVEPRLFGLLEQAARLHGETEGAFDITTGALTKTWGFFRRQGRVPESAELAEAQTRVGMGHVTLDPERRTVAFGRRGLEINLGSIGKGHALDRAAERVREWGLASFLVHGGHSSMYAAGSEPDSRSGWSVGITDPWEPGRRLAVLRLQNQALGTSAATFQHIEYQGRKLGHILDPRTGWPAEGVASASVVAPTAAEADALATAFFILGVQKARAYCQRHAEIGALILPAGESARPVLINLGPGQIEMTCCD
jgi:thiamine biosynthesis lipoprotein